MFQIAFSVSMLFAAATATCTPNELNICMSLDLHASETGYYNLNRGDYEETVGSSPAITVKIGQTITFDQTDASNWYHPVGFAYAPDGAHGDTWGGAENPEVEGLGELVYKIDGQETTCADKGDTGLDCFEPEFFYPRSEWLNKEYVAELTITEEVAQTAKGGVLYYFCHIHSKMSGKIIIKNADGSDYSSDSDELPLYEPITNDGHDTNCGTTGASPYADGGSRECNTKFFGGDHDTTYEKCLQSIDCKMNYEMFSETESDSDDKVVTFMQQMIPHHENAVNMAKLLLKHATPEELATVDEEGGFEDILHDIINVQNYQIHQFRNYLNGDGIDALREGESGDGENKTSSAAGMWAHGLTVIMFIAGTLALV